MSKFNKEAFAEKLIKMANEFVSHDYKANAVKELDDIELSGKHVPNIAFIVDKYPDFNYIELKCEQPGNFMFKICVNPQLILNNPQFALTLADTYAFWIENGGQED